MEKVICITGASDGLGEALARFFSKENRVILIARNEAKLQKIAQETGAKYYVCDVTNHTALESVMKSVIAENKRIDVLINSAGLLVDGELSNCDYNEIKSLIDVNLTGLIYSTKSVVPYMKKQKQGLIININSQAGFGALAEKSIYNASKWGVNGFSKCLQPELSKYGIKVTDVFPGRMNTKMFEKIGQKRNMDNAIKLEDMIQIIDFLITLPKDVVIPEIGVKHINN